MADLAVFEEGERVQRWIQFDEDTEVLLEFLPKQELKAELRKAEKTAKLSGGNVNDILNTQIQR